tara:strand:- start:2644 stop:2817 length:174 start_codon:yes stop_codon:yes gene_type:complete
MIEERVKITVKYQGKEYARVVSIFSDGCFDTVEKKVHGFVALQWVNRFVESVSWQYV